jgi:hypothetical protein
VSHRPTCSYCGAELTEHGHFTCACHTRKPAAPPVRIEKWSDNKTGELESPSDGDVAMYLRAETAEARVRDLLKQLEGAERAWRAWNDNMSLEASKWEQRAGELEEKLVEAEKQAIAAELSSTRDYRRAEAAEARVKELEETLARISGVRSVKKL